jgi:aspartate/methionine/tyrosine aminotransferase
MKLNDITQHEIEALKHTYNVSDAHTHQSQSATQRDIVKRLPDLWYESERTRQYDMEQKFLGNFFRVRRQPTALENAPPLLVYAASIAMAITANYLMKKRMTVGLVHPCFDNLVDLMKHMEVPLTPVDERWFHEPSKIYENLERNVTTDAIFIVDPNNPTGFTLFNYGRQGWAELFRFAKEKGKLLIFDFCFANFMTSDNNFEIFDIYEMLEQSGVSYIAMEDTGKTWPLQDAKAAILKTSADIYDDVYNIHTAFLLNVSPFILNVLTQYVVDSERDGFASVTDLLERNRALAHYILDGSLLEPVQPMAKVSVLWCRIKRDDTTASQLKQYLTSYGIHLLPGTYFYWADKSEGERYVRIALARNTDVFGPAMRSLRNALDRYTGEVSLLGSHQEVLAQVSGPVLGDAIINLENTGFLDKKEIAGLVRSRRTGAAHDEKTDHRGAAAA